MLWRPQPQSGQSFCEDGEGETISLIFYVFNSFQNKSFCFENTKRSTIYDCVSLLACGPSQSIEELEKEMLEGQKLQGPATAAEVYRILKHKNLIDK